MSRFGKSGQLVQLCQIRLLLWDGLFGWLASSCAEKTISRGGSRDAEIAEKAAENRPGDAGHRPAPGGSHDPENKQRLTLPLFVFGIVWPSCSRDARVAGTGPAAASLLVLSARLALSA